MAELLAISDQSYNEILMELGYPFVKEEELEFPKETIINMMIWPALQQYYMYFPLQVQQQISTSGSFELPFPDEETFGITDARINNTFIGSGALTTNPFLNSLLVNRQASSSRYGSPYGYNLEQAKTYERYERQSILEDIRSFKIHVDENNRKVTGYTNVAGRLSITWAKYDYNFEAIPFKWKRDVLKLSKSYVLRAFGNLRAQLKQEDPDGFDYQNFLDRADNYNLEVMDRWEGISKVVVLRG